MGCAKGGLRVLPIVLAAVLVGSALAGCSQTADVVPNEPVTTTADRVSAKNSDSKANCDLTFDHIPSDLVIGVDELHEWLESSSEDDDLLVVDVRTRGEYNAGYIDGSISVPAGQQFYVRMEEIPRDKTVVLVDRNENRSAEVWQTLADNGYNSDQIYVLEGGARAWIRAGYPTIFIENPPC